MAHEPVPLHLNWDSFDETYGAVAAALGIAADQLLHLSQVYQRPIDLQDLQVEAMIAHVHDDIPAGAQGSLILADVEFHHLQPLRAPEIVRRVLQVPNSLQRSALFRGLGLMPYCRDVGHIGLL